MILKIYKQIDRKINYSYTYTECNKTLHGSSCTGAMFVVGLL